MRKKVEKDQKGEGGKQINELKKSWRKKKH